MKTKLLGNLKKGLIFILSAPGGTGKTTLVRNLVEEFECVSVSVSYTTRQPRPGEVDGVDYNFISKEEFERKIESNDFLEYVKLYGYYYGTSGQWVQKKIDQGKHVILVIDTQGGLQLRSKIPAKLIFVKPPSLEVLEERLTKRKTESDEAIKTRMLVAKREMEDGQAYDYQIINDDLATAYTALKSILVAEEHRTQR
jgi:guanylate kinase